MTRRVIPLAAALALLPACQFCDQNDAFLPRAGLDPAVLDLGAITSGTKCDATVGVTNTGNADLTIETGSVKLIDTDGDFTVLRAPTLVGIGAKQDLVISYVAAGTTGERQSTGFELATNDPNAAVLRGSVTAFVADAPVPLAVAKCVARDAAADAPLVACTDLDFGAVPISEGGAGLALQVVLTNEGNKDLTLQAVAINGSSDFVVDAVQRGSLVVPLPATVPAGRTGDCGEPTGADNTLTISVKYVPRTIGAGVATLNILTDGAEGSSISVALSGQGSDTNLLTNPETVLFGEVDEGSTVSKDVLVQNVGTEPASVNESCIDLEDDGTCDGLCTGSDVDVTNGGTLRCAAFDAAGTQVGKGFVLGATDAAPGGDDERTITIDWSPTATQASIPAGAVLILKSNIRNNKVFKVALRGGNVGTLEVTSDEPCGSDHCINAAGDLADTESWTGSTTLTLRNSGTASLTLGTIDFEEGTAPTIADDFTIGAPGTTTLAPGATTTLEIEYANDDASQVDGFNLIIENNGSQARTLASIVIVPPAAP